MTDHQTTFPEFTPTLEGFRVDEFLELTETLLAIPIEQDPVRLDAAPFRLTEPEPLPEAPLEPLPPRWYPRPAEAVIEAARRALNPPPRPAALIGREGELQRVLRPLLAGHPIRVCGEPGVGKTALLATVATHQRTRQRFRRVWWIDQPDRLDQTLALALDLPHALADPDPAARRAWLGEVFDEHTLLIVDNVAADDAQIDALLELTPHVLLGVETGLEMLDEDEALPDDPEGVVTLRVLDDSHAVDALAYYCGIEDTRRLRDRLQTIVVALGNHPYALMLAGKLVSKDGLSLDELEDTLALEDFRPDESAGDGDTGDDPDADAADDEPLSDHSASLNRALDVSVEALPRAYQRLFDACGAFPPGGVPFEGLCAAARIGSELACRRGLIMLAEYGFVRADPAVPGRYAMHPVAYARAVESDPHADDSPVARRMRRWAVSFAREHAGDPLALYHAESALLHALQFADRRDDLYAALELYLYEYAPQALDDAHPDAPPALAGPRAEAAHLIEVGRELTEEGALLAAEQALTQALDLQRQHGSPHAIAEALVALGRLYDYNRRYADAADTLIEAAELVYNLNAADSLSVIRRGLARVYRHMDRLNDALGVLDDTPQAHLERALILRGKGEYDAAVREIDQADDATPYLRAETFLLAGQYGAALAAIAEHDDPASSHLRAQVYHLQGSLDEAVRGYEIALERYASSDPARAKTLRGLGAALAAAGRYEDACAALEQALEVQRAASKPDKVRLGRTLRLLAAVRLAQGDHDAAITTALTAIKTLQHVDAPGDIADAYRTQGRAYWRVADYPAALEAFSHEAEHAQSVPRRDEARIGTALHHVADAYHMTGSLDRAIANYRLALTHKKPTTDPDGYLITQLALHRALMEADRLPAALDISQEALDHLLQRTTPNLAQVGLVQAVRARTQQANQRPIRASQSVMEWVRLLAANAEDTAEDPRPAIRVLALGLAARSLLAENRPALAERIAQRSLETAEEHYPHTLAAWAARRDLGAVYMALDRPADALDMLDPLLLEVLQEHPHTYARVYELAGRAHRALGSGEMALEHLRVAFEHEPDRHRQGLLHELIGAIQLEIGEPEAAVESYRAALPLLDREAHPDAVARVLTTLAHTLGGLNRYAEAIGVYEDALSVLRDVEDVSLTHTADVLRALGETHEAQGQRPDAARVYRRALNLLERADAPRQERDLLHQLARVTAAMGDQSAVQLYEQTRDMTEKWGDPQAVGVVLRELADVHRDAGRMTLAVQHYQLALEHQPEQLMARERAQTLRSLGRAYAQMERYDNAREIWTEALDLSQTLPDESPVEIALTHHAIGEAYHHQGHYDDAERSFREALQHHAPGTVAAADTYRAYGRALHAAGRHSDAREPLQKALEAERAQPQQANARLVHTLQLLADVHEATGDLAAAVARLHEALVYMDRELQPVAYADTLRALGWLYRDMQNYPQAHKALQDALDIEREHVPRSDERISQTLQAIADTYRDEGDLEQAAAYYQKVTVYANYARQASEDLRETLDELDRRRATLQAAQQSLALLDRHENADLKDVSFIYALIARAYADLNQPQASADTIHTLLDTLAEQRADLDADAGEPDLRALAWLDTAAQAQDDDPAAAQQACTRALDLTTNANLRWVIEQFARSVAG